MMMMIVICVYMIRFMCIELLHEYCCMKILINNLILVDLKQNCYGALLDSYVNFFGQADGEKLAAADSGPLDEAYVGGGS